MNPRKHQAIEVELIRDARPWWRDLRELAYFGRWLQETGRAPADVWEVVERPWTWSEAHDEYLRDDADRADERDDDDLQRRTSAA